MTRVAAAPMPWMKRSASRIVEARRESRGESGGDIDRQVRPAAARAGRSGRRSGRRAVARRRSPEVGGDHILPMVFVLDAEAGADLLQPGQHDVDGQRVERHQRGGHRDEFPARNRQDEAGFLRRSLLVHGARPVVAKRQMRRKAGASTPRGVLGRARKARRSLGQAARALMPFSLRASAARRPGTFRG